MVGLFRDLQIARFNELYYQRRSASMHRWAVSANIVSAISASAVLLNLLKDGGSPLGFGPGVWQLLTGLAAVSAAVGPILGWERKASQFEKASLGHGIVRERIRSLLIDLKLSALDESHRARQQEIEAVRLSLLALDEPASEKLKEKCWEQTLQEIPSDRAWTLL